MFLTRLLNNFVRWYKLLRCILFPVTVFFQEYIELYYSFNPIYCTSRFCQVEDRRLNFYSFYSFLIFCAILSYIRLLVLFWWAYAPLRKEGKTGVLLPDRWKLKYLPLKIRGVFLRIKLLWNLNSFLIIVNEWIIKNYHVQSITILRYLM